MKWDDAITLAVEAEKRYNRAIALLMCMKRVSPLLPRCGSIASLFGRQRGAAVHALMRDFARSTDAELRRVAHVYANLRNVRAEDAGLPPNEVTLLDALYATPETVKAFRDLLHAARAAGADGLDVERERELHLLCARALLAHPDFEMVEKEAVRYSTLAHGIATSFARKRKR